MSAMTRATLHGAIALLVVASAFVPSVAAQSAPAAVALLPTNSLALSRADETVGVPRTSWRESLIAASSAMRIASVALVTSLSRTRA